MTEFVRANSQRTRILRGEVIAMAPTAPVRHNAEVIECVKTSHRQRLPTSSGSPRQPAKVISAEAGNQNQRLASVFTTERTKDESLTCIGLVDRGRFARLGSPVSVITLMAQDGRLGPGDLGCHK
jgi:hypothetical protein